ncbi:MAG: endonuclease/exonuclease/phosphatase family protein [Treponema sp.]|nr:endonuclease/exonuclease/phosphatase family protein [Treponema sp.]
MKSAVCMWRQLRGMVRMFVCVAGLLLFASPFLFAGTLKILSFNMNGRTNDDMVERLSSLIDTSGADIVFLQEVTKGKADKSWSVLDRVVWKLGTSSWAYCTTFAYSLPRTVERGNPAETYVFCAKNQNNAVLYKKLAVRVKDRASEFGFNSFSGRFLFDKNTVQVLEVVPCENTKPQEFSFVAINVHLPYTDKAHRARDLATLEALYASCKLRQPVLVAGDFNTRRRDLTKRNFDHVDGDDRWFSDPAVGLKTTLSTSGTEEVVFANDYDHFVFSKTLPVSVSMRRVSVQDGKDRTRSVSFGNATYTSSSAFRKDVSDHIPIELLLEW